MCLDCIGGSKDNPNNQYKYSLTQNKYLRWDFFNKHWDDNILDWFESIYINMSIEIIITP